MSNYGPALFIVRIDNKPLEKREQADLLKAVVQSCQKHTLNDDCGDPVSPRVDGYERNTLSILIYSSSTYSLMPEEAQIGQKNADLHELVKVEHDLEERYPGTYAFRSYYVEC
jgi:hypothetical protein